MGRPETCQVSPDQRWIKTMSARFTRTSTSIMTSSMPSPTTKEDLPKTISRWIDCWTAIRMAAGIMAAGPWPVSRTAGDSGRGVAGLAIRLAMELLP